MAKTTRRIEERRSPARRTSTLSTQPPAELATTTDLAAQFEQTRTHLESIEIKLIKDVRPETLGEDDRKAWENQRSQIDLAISRIRNTALEKLNNEFKDELPAIEAATGKLAASLAKLKRSVDIIKAVAGALGVVSQIVKLLA